MPLLPGRTGRRPGDSDGARGARSTAARLPDRDGGPPRRELRDGLIRRDVENLAIARVLAEIGDLLEIKSENSMKIRAYRNAAETVAHATERRADLSPAQRLAIAGIGKDLAAKIGELVDTGTIAYHQD